jgi:hypothetical protein
MILEGVGWGCLRPVGQTVMPKILIRNKVTRTQTLMDIPPPVRPVKYIHFGISNIYTVFLYLILPAYAADK